MSRQNALIAALKIGVGGRRCVSHFVHFVDLTVDATIFGVLTLLYHIQK